MGLLEKWKQRKFDNQFTQAITANLVDTSKMTRDEFLADLDRRVARAYGDETPEKLIATAQKTRDEARQHVDSSDKAESAFGREQMDTADALERLAARLRGKEQSSG